MSVIVITKFEGAATKLEEMGGGPSAQMLTDLSTKGREMGAIHHEFIEDSDGNVLALDEWESEEAYHAFFDNQKDIGALMEQAGVTTPPSTTSYRILSMPDRF
jgi:heme-degrading monooxygenase HmoA